MLDKETALKVARLARLKLEDWELENYCKVLTAVLEHFDQIAEIPIDGVEPLVTPTEMVMSIREDTVEKTVDSERIIENAPEKSGRLFRVPPVV